jgi:DNA-binding NarL/FixJ family response regulator
MGVRAQTRKRPLGRKAGGGKVLLLDEHPLWLDALERVLVDEGLEVVATTTSPEAALKAIASQKPDAFVASIELPNSKMDGVECLQRARERAPELKIVVLPTSDKAFHLSAAVAAGADAYVPKTAVATEIAAAIRDSLLPANGSGRASLVARELEGGAARPALTPRELEILRLVARGFTNEQISERLWITKSTVKFHLVNAYRKLGVSNRTQAARYIFGHDLALPLDRSA